MAGFSTLIKYLKIVAGKPYLQPITPQESSWADHADADLPNGCLVVSK